MKITELRIDGYKNLIQCKVPLEDFNVIVGANNSGKSNFLEIFETFCLLSSSDERHRHIALRAHPYRSPIGSTIPHLTSHKDSPLSIGVSFETKVSGLEWLVSYDATVTRSVDPALGGFLAETLTAKLPNSTGPAHKYIDRDGIMLRINRRRHTINMRTPAIGAFAVLYPEPENLTPKFQQLKHFLDEILFLGNVDVLALSPGELRQTLFSDEDSPSFRTSAFNILLAIEHIWGAKDARDSFKESVCEILDLEDITFQINEVPLRGGSADNKNVKKTRRCVVRRSRGEEGHLSECSDGTLVVFAIVAAMLSGGKDRSPICIEELENCLHPRAIEKLLRFLQEQSSKRQVIITTHSPYLLNGVEPSSVLVAVVDDTGATHFEKPTNRKAISAILKSKYMDFGDLLVTNFEEVLAPRDSK